MYGRVALGSLFLMTTYSEEEKLIRLLLSRLERISADSVWAHRASGIRGALIRQLESTENGKLDSSRNMEFIKQGFYILEATAREK